MSINCMCVVYYNIHIRIDIEGLLASAVLADRLLDIATNKLKKLPRFVTRNLCSLHDSYTGDIIYISIWEKLSLTSTFLRLIQASCNNKFHAV